MSHRVIIIDSVSKAFAAPEVRAEMGPSQCQKVDAILQSAPEPTPAKFLELAYQLARAYSKED